MTKRLLIEYGTMVFCISYMNLELTIPCGIFWKIGNMNERTLFILQQLITKFFNLYQYLSLARMLTRGGHCCGTKPETDPGEYYGNKYFLSFAGVNSEHFKISQSVGQGRMLSAFMFLVYINDLFYRWQSVNKQLAAIFTRIIICCGIICLTMEITLQSKSKCFYCYQQRVTYFIKTWCSTL